MGASNWSGPIHVYGDLTQIQSPPGTIIVPDPNLDRGPSLFYMGTGIFDVRYEYLKDKVQGYSGVVPALIHATSFIGTSGIPAAFQTNNIAAAQHVASGVAMTLAAASTGITLNVPISPIGGLGNSLNASAVVTTGIALDFGFGFGNCTANSATIVVSSSNLYSLGMPLVIGGVGNSAGTIPLLTQVASIVDSTHITVIATNVPLATNATAPIGTGNLWGPSEIGYPLPTAAFPALGRGPGLFFDARQGIARGVSIAGASGGTGGTFIVSGWDVYGEPMSQLITVGAGASTGYSLKAFKYIGSIVPQFTDSSHNYTVGTSDVFGFNGYAGIWEATGIAWAGSSVGTNVGWTAPDTTNPATNATGDVRSTVQVSSIGGGTPITGGTASTGTVSGLVMTGNRLFMEQDFTMFDTLNATSLNPAPLFGQIQT